MKNNTTGTIINSIIYLLIILIIIYGWVLNLIMLFTSFDESITVEFGVRIVGIIIVPLGAVMGLFF